MIGISSTAARALVYASLTRTRDTPRMISVVAVTITNGANDMGVREGGVRLRG